MHIWGACKDLLIVYDHILLDGVDADDEDDVDYGYDFKYRYILFL